MPTVFLNNRTELLQEKADDLERVKRYAGAEQIDTIIRKVKEQECVEQKHYKETIALDNVSLHIPRGAIYGLIGNNGAGKTTLMRILSNLQSPSSGTVVKSENIKIGAIIETPALYPTLSAKGNLKYQLKICGCPSKEVKSKIAELLELVHLKDTRKLVMNYSLGMRQRLALAMALVGNPQFLILDEPLNGLDPEGIQILLRR